MYVHEERERISVKLVTTAVQGCVSDLCLSRARVCAGWHYFANLSTLKHGISVLSHEKHAHSLKR